MKNNTTIAGYSMLTFRTIAPNAGFVFIQLKDWDERPDPRGSREPNGADG